MNKTQKLILKWAIPVYLLIFLFPPFAYEHYKRKKERIEYGFILSPEQKTSYNQYYIKGLKSSILFAEILGASFFFGLLLLLNTKEKDKK